ESSAGEGGYDEGGGDPSGGGRCPVGGVPAEDAPESESGERGDGEGGPVGEPQEAGPHAPGADEEEEGDVHAAAPSSSLKRAATQPVDQPVSAATCRCERPSRIALATSARASASLILAGLSGS